MSNKLLQDSDGNTSSKRVAGYIAGGFGLALIVAVGIVSMFTVLKDPSTTIDAGKTLIYVAAILLGIGTFEKFAK